MDNQLELNQGFINLNDLLNDIPDCFLQEIKLQEKHEQQQQIGN